MADDSNFIGFQMLASLMQKHGVLPAALFARLWVFTNNGRQPCFYTDKTAMSELGEGLRPIRRAFDVLVKTGLVKVTIVKAPYGRHKSYVIDMSMLNSGVYAKCTDPRVCAESKDPSMQNAKTDMSETHRPVLSDRIDRSEKRSKKESKRGSESEPAPSHPAQIFLQSADEVMTKMGEWINKHRMRHPVLDSVDLPMEADGLYLKYRTKKVDLEALVDAWMRRLVTAREAKAKVVYSGKAPVMSIREGVNKDRAELERMFGAVNEIQTQCLEVKDDA